MNQRIDDPAPARESTPLDEHMVQWQVIQILLLGAVAGGYTLWSILAYLFS